MNLRTWAVLSGMLILQACGGGGGSSKVGMGKGNGGSSPKVVYVALIATDQAGHSSAFSNEISRSIHNGDTETLSWSEPTRRIDGQCITDLPLSYTLLIGSSTGNYGTKLSPSDLQSQGKLDCGEPSGQTDQGCGNIQITKCTYTGPISVP